MARNPPWTTVAGAEAKVNTLPVCPTSCVLNWMSAVAVDVTGPMDACTTMEKIGAGAAISAVKEPE